MKKPIIFGPGEKPGLFLLFTVWGARESLINQGDPEAEARLMTLVYDELRRLAGYYMRREKPGNSLQATALVHEVYLRLV